MKDITYSAAVSLHLAEREHHKHLAKSTLRVYKITLLDFARSDSSLDGGVILLRDIPRDTWTGYMDGREHMSNRDWNAILSRLSAFTKWACAEGYLSTAEKRLGGCGCGPTPPRSPRCSSGRTSSPASWMRPGSGTSGTATSVRRCGTHGCEAMWYSRRPGRRAENGPDQGRGHRALPRRAHGVLTWTNHKAHRPGQHLNMSLPLHRTIAEWLAIYEQLTGEKPGRRGTCSRRWPWRECRSRGHRRRLVLNPEHPIAEPGTIAREAFRRAGIWEPRMATHAFRRGSATDLYERAIEQGHKHPLRVVMTALDHSTEQMSENYLDKSRDTRDLTELEQQIYGGEAVPAAGPEPAIAEPAASTTG